MIKERQIEEMAKLDGWVKTCDAPDIWEKGRYCVGPESLDYLHDHNAVQRVIDGLDDDTKKQYWNFLMPNWDWDYKSVGATCRQKVEAILKATGRWEE